MDKTEHKEPNPHTVPGGIGAKSGVVLSNDYFWFIQNRKQVNTAKKTQSRNPPLRRYKSAKISFQKPKSLQANLLKNDRFSRLLEVPEPESPPCQTAIPNITAEAKQHWIGRKPRSFWRNWGAPIKSFPRGPKHLPGPLQLTKTKFNQPAKL